MKLPDDNDSIDVYQDAGGDWRWRLQAGNGKIIADSAEGYETSAGAYRAASRVFPDTPASPTPSGPSVTPRPAPYIPWWVFAALFLVLIAGFVIGWVMGRDRGREANNNPVTTTTTQVRTPEGTVITDSKTTVLEPKPVTTVPQSPSADPPPTTQR